MTTTAIERYCAYKYLYIILQFLKYRYGKRMRMRNMVEHIADIKQDSAERNRWKKGQRNRFVGENTHEPIIYKTSTFVCRTG